MWRNSYPNSSTWPTYSSTTRALILGCVRTDNVWIVLFYPPGHLTLGHSSWYIGKWKGLFHLKLYIKKINTWHIFSPFQNFLWKIPKLFDVSYNINWGKEGDTYRQFMSKLYDRRCQIKDCKPRSTDFLKNDIIRQKVYRMIYYLCKVLQNDWNSKEQRSLPWFLFFFLIFQTKLFNILTMCSPQQFAELGMLNLYLTNIPTINHPDDEIRESTRK